MHWRSCARRRRGRARRGEPQPPVACGSRRKSAVRGSAISCANGPRPRTRSNGWRGSTHAGLHRRLDRPSGERRPARARPRRSSPVSSISTACSPRARRCMRPRGRRRSTSCSPATTRARATASARGDRSTPSTTTSSTSMAGRESRECTRSSRAAGSGCPRGASTIRPDTETAHGLANRKNDALRRRLGHDGVSAFDGSLRFLEVAHEAGLRCAVVSASENTDAILDRSGSDELVDAVVDGEVIQSENLRAKPAPDWVLAACRRLAVRPEPSRASRRRCGHRRRSLGGGALGDRGRPVGPRGVARRGGCRPRRLRSRRADRSAALGRPSRCGFLRSGDGRRSRWPAGGRERGCGRE